jgi:hypothetical protein
LGATFEVSAPPNLCPALTVMEGTVTGSIDFGFTWTAVPGAMAIKGKQGTKNLLGAGTFMFIGNPCGQSNVQATVAGTIVVVP